MVEDCTNSPQSEDCLFLWLVPPNRYSGLGRPASLDAGGTQKTRERRAGVHAQLWVLSPEARGGKFPAPNQLQPRPATPPALGCSFAGERAGPRVTWGSSCPAHRFLNPRGPACLRPSARGLSVFLLHDPAQQPWLQASSVRPSRSMAGSRLPQARPPARAARRWPSRGSPGAGPADCVPVLGLGLQSQVSSSDPGERRAKARE